MTQKYEDEVAAVERELERVFIEIQEELERGKVRPFLKVRLWIASIALKIFNKLKD